MNCILCQIKENEESKKFTGPEKFPTFVRVVLGVMMKTYGKKRFMKAAAQLGCERPLDDRPYTP